MSDDKKFLTRHDVELRLNGCMIKYKGKYYQACLPGSEEGATDFDTRLHLYSLKTRKKTSIILDSNSGDFQYQFYDALGWTPITIKEGTSDQSYYIARAPYRRFKAGLSAGAIIASAHANHDSAREGIGSEFFESEEFTGMLEGKYPSIKEVTDALASFKAGLNAQIAMINRHSGWQFWNIGLHRDWAARIYLKDAEIKLCHGLFEVGTINFNKNFVRFFPQFNNSFYWERLNEKFVNQINIDTTGGS